MYQNQARIAILSSRVKNNFIFNSCLYEFEDIIAEVDNVDLINLAPSNALSVFAQKVVKKTAQYVYPCTQMSPPLDSKIDLEKEYDILFVILDFPYSIINVNLINQWRKKCKIAVCYIIELWHTELQKFHNYLTYLNNFDFIFLGHSQIVEDVEKIAKRPCAYLAPASDTIKFCPTSVNSDRFIDVTTMGRRSAATHEALLSLSQKGNFFYHYDSLNSSDLRTNNYQAHRIFNGNILKHSKYFIAHHAKINCLKQTGGQIEIGYRFFEGAAAGAVMLGTAPKNNIFEEYFGWNNAVIPMKFDEPNIAMIMEELNNQPELLKQIRCDNIKNSLQQHDWMHRWEQVLTAAGVTPTEKLIARKNRLQQLAQQFTLLDSSVF
jgi:hypothetical protein